MCNFFDIVKGFVLGVKSMGVVGIILVFFMSKNGLENILVFV